MCYLAALYDLVLRHHVQLLLIALVDICQLCSYFVAMDKRTAEYHKAHRQKWADALSDSEDEGGDFCEEDRTHALLILYNICCKPQNLLEQEEKQRIHDLLKEFNEPEHIMNNLKSCSVLDLCCVGASTKASMKNSAWNSKVGTITIALITGENIPCSKELYKSKLDKKLINYSPSSFSIFAFPQSSKETLHNKSLKNFSGQKVCLANFLQLFHYNLQLIHQFKRITVSHTVALYTASSGRDDRKGQFKQQVDTNIALGQTIQRILNFAYYKNNEDAPLEICPCHIGRSDNEEWTSMDDPCKKNIHTAADMLKSCCTCGRMTFKAQTDQIDKGIGDNIQMSSWKSVLLHNLKDNMMQSFLGGCIEHALEGQIMTVVNNTRDKKQSRFIISQERQTQNELGKMLNHLIFVFDLNRVEAMLDGAFHFNSQRKDKLDATIILETIPLRNLVECGEFHLAGHYIDDKKNVLLLQNPSKIEGRAGLLIGNYVGPHLYAIESVLQRRTEIPTRAMQAMLSKHMTESDKHEIENNAGSIPMSFLEKITPEDIQKELRNKHLTEEQKTVCGNLSKCCFIDAVAGSGKSTIGAGILAATLKKIKPLKDGRKRKMVWLTQTRTQRDDALSAIRKILDEPLMAVGIGRQVNNCATDFDDTYVDPEMASYFRSKLSKYYASLDNIKRQQEKNNSEEVNNINWNLRRKLADDYAQKLFQLEKAQAHMLADAFEKVDIVCMTIDGFNQVQSGMSTLSKIFENTEISLGIVDEAHQVEVHILLAALSSIEEAVCFYDRAQKIDRNNDDEYRSKGHGGFSLMKEDSTNCFHWDRCVGLEDNQKLYIWDIVDLNYVSSLPVSFRFNEDVCKLLRLTSKAYKTTDANYHANHGIYAASEMPSFDHKTKDLLPNTKIQITTYAQHLFHPVDKTNMLLSKCTLITARMKDSKAIKNCHYVGCSIPMLAAMVHEGLVFLSMLKNHKITGVGSKEFPCLTMIYLNAPREVFDIVVNAVLQDPEICDKYGIECISNPSSAWKVLTPDTGSGMTVCFAQLVLLPRKMCYADTTGNLKDDGRKNVGCTRARLFLSIHVCEECLQSEEISDTWSEFAKLVFKEQEDNEFKNYIKKAKLFDKKEDKFDTEIADWLLQPSLDARHNYVDKYEKASAQLWNKVSTLPQNYQSFKNCYDEHRHEKTTRTHRSQTFIDQFLAILQECNRRQNELEEICMQGIIDDVIWIPAKNFVDKINTQFESSEKLRPYLLPSAAITFDGKRCSMRQYMLYSIERTLKESWLCVQSIAAFFLRISWELFEEREDQYVVSDTNTSLRIATKEVGLDSPKMKLFIRKETTPKKCLPDMDTIIFEKMSVEVMQRLAAATLFYTRNQEVKKDMFRFVHNPRIGCAKTKEESSHAESEAEKCITVLLTKLHDKYDVNTLTLQNEHPSLEANPTNRRQPTENPANSTFGTIIPANPTLGIWDTLPRKVNLTANIGIDIVGVLATHREDWHNKRVQWHSTTKSEVPAAVRGVQNLVKIFGAEHVFMVSYAENADVREKIEHWLEVTNFSTKTGFLKKNLYFTNMPNGSEGKGPLAKQLNLIYFVDDKAHHLQSIYRDPQGNNGYNIDQNNGRLYHFPRSGNFRHRPAIPWMGDSLPKCLEQVENWDDVILRIRELMA